MSDVDVEGRLGRMRTAYLDMHAELVAFRHARRTSGVQIHHASKPSRICIQHKPMLRISMHH
eukprot:411555-Pleurochrysis_carterae.AAC.2